MCWQKIPTLLELSSNVVVEIEKPRVVHKFETKIKKITTIFQKHVLLHKFLFSVKCIVSKIEHKIDNWLHHLRKKAQQNKNKD